MKKDVATLTYVCVLTCTILFVFAFQLPSNAYATKEQIYQQQNNILPESILPQRYYNEYEQQSSPPSKGNIVPNIYDESQQLAYQQEVNVGNQLQAIRQKTVTAKFEKNVNKGTLTFLINILNLKV